jgi:hypothetical protein
VNKPFIDLEFGPIGQRKPRRVTRAGWVVLALMLCVEYSCLSAAVRQAGGPAGQRIPKEPPDEANRVRHPLGFSMVAPPRWSHTGISGLLMSSNRNRRSEGLIDVSHIGHERPSRLEGMRKTRFLGQEAYHDMQVVRRDTFDDPAWSEYTLYFRRGEDWYEIRYGIAEERTELPPMILRYLNTLRFDDRPPEAAP